MPADPARPSVSRRTFLQTSAAVGAAAWWPTASAYARIPGANARLEVAYIGVGGIASSQHVPKLEALGAGCPAYCDADSNRWGACAERWPEAVGYTDYRRMMDKHGRDIDAVMVGTPDHQHYPATIMAMMMGKHVYTQKPLTHTVWEARQLTLAQERYRLATQMGNQGHASDSLRVTIDYLRGGAIGDLVEAHVWTDRPWWRQGLPRPAGAATPPKNLDWEAWIGPAPMRPFLNDPTDRWGGVYHPFNWRGWWDFGCGALGDMACHELDPVYWAMTPGLPTAVELVATTPFGAAEMFGKESTVRFEFPARGERPAFRLYWYEGGRKPPRPEGLEDDVELTGQGALYIGTGGTMISLPSARSAPRLLPTERQEEYGTPEPQIERSAEGHHKEWYLACTGEKPYDFPRGNFAYSGPMTEAILLGCIAQRVGGRLEYDAKDMRFENNAEATALITKAYRSGWDFRMD